MVTKQTLTQHPAYAKKRHGRSPCFIKNCPCTHTGRVGPGRAGPDLAGPPSPSIAPRTVGKSRSNALKMPSSPRYDGERRAFRGAASISTTEDQHRRPRNRDKTETGYYRARSRTGACAPTRAHTAPELSGAEWRQRIERDEGTKQQRNTRECTPSAMELLCTAVDDRTPNRDPNATTHFIPHT